MLSDYSIEEFTEKLNLQDFQQKGKQIIQEKRNMLQNDIIDIISKILSIIEGNIEYLSAKHIFSDDISKTFYIIITATNIYFNALSKLKDPKIEENDKSNFIQKIQYDMKIFCSSLTVFSNEFSEIITSISELKGTTNEKKLDNLNLRLGIECSLFNFCVKVNESQQFPYFKSKFVQVYNFKDKINSTTDKIALFKSYSGTGKNICFPLFLFSKSLKDDISHPIVLMTMLTPYLAEEKKKQLNVQFSKYVYITNNPNELSQIFNDEGEKQKMTLCILTTYSILPLMNKYKDNPKFLNSTRFIFNDLFQKSFHISVIISQIIELFNKKSLQLSLNAVMLSPYFPPEIENIFKGIASITSLLKQPQYSITECVFKYVHQSRIEVKIQKAIKKTIYKMAGKNGADGKIEEGHIICFLPNTLLCNQIRNMIISDTKFTNSKTSIKKIIIINAFLKPNEEPKEFMDRIAKNSEYCKSKELDNDDCIYFLPLVVSGATDENINSIVRSNFPQELKGINKLIFTTKYLEYQNIEDVSAVIDSGLFEDLIFNPDNGITSRVQKTCPAASMELRKGRLGLTMNGLYCTFSKKVENDEIHEPELLERDITNNLLLMKRLNIDFENLNLPYKVKKENLEYSINLLAHYGLINNNNENGIEPLEISDFDINELGINFSIPFYYVASIIKFSNSFTDENERKYAYLIASYISLIIINSKFLIKDEISEELAKYHDENSDIVTLFKALNELIKICINESNKQTHFQSNSNESNSNESAPNKPTPNQLASNQSRHNRQRLRGSKSYNSENKELKRCFKYREVFKLINRMKAIAKHHFENEDFSTIFENMIDFANKKEIYNIIDNFIDKIEIKLNNEAEDKWKKVHSFKFHGIRNIKTDRNPELIFLGSDELKVNKNQVQGKIFIIKRPGMKGLAIPSQIYCFNIECKIENDNYKKLIGHIIHQKRPCNTVNSTIEINGTYVLNPWFNVLLDIYFNRNKENKKVKFYYTTLGEKVFLSFNNRNNDNKNYSFNEIKEGVNKCSLIFPYTPRGILIYQSNLNVVVQARSLGSSDYISEDSTNFYCEILNREIIDQLCDCRDNLNISDPKKVICSLFTKETCKYKELDRDNLYVVSNMHNTNDQNVIKIVQNKISQMKNRMQLYAKSNKKEGLFQFPKDLVHPSLFYCEEPRKSILNWLGKYWASTHKNENKDFEVVGHRIKMNIFEIQEFQNFLFKNDKKEIKKEMKLQYEAISFPVELQKTISCENTKWHINKKFNTIIAPTEDVDEVKQLIESKKEQYNSKNNSLLKKNKIQPVYCTYECDKQEISEFPFTILFSDDIGSLKVCKYCMTEILKTALQGLYSNEINTKALEKINTKPEWILSIPSKSFKENDDSLIFPLIPIGQFISVLFNSKDNELSSLTSGFLQAICEFTIRFRMKEVFTFCPNNPHRIFRVKDIQNEDFKCPDNKCDYAYCHKCHLMHSKEFDCTKKLPTGEQLCPNCNTPIKKEGGCNIVKCRCATRFCFICRKELKTDVIANEHLANGHENDPYSDDIIY